MQPVKTKGMRLSFVSLFLEQGRIIKMRGSLVEGVRGGEDMKGGDDMRAVGWT